jgi:hypothetical protein
MSGILRAGPSLWLPGRFRQPGVPRIDGSHPLTHGLVSYWWPLDSGSGYIDLVTGDTTKKSSGSKNSLPVIGGSQFGNGPSFASTSAFCEGVNTPSQSWSAPYSFASGWYQLAGSLPGSTAGWWGIADPSSNDPFMIFQNGPSTLGFSYGNAASAFSFTFSASTFYVGVGAATGTTTQSSWINGLAQTAGTATSAFSGSNLRYVFGDPTADSSASQSCNSLIFFGATWSGRALTQQDAIQLYTDPYSMLMPPEGEMPVMGGFAPPNLASLFACPPGFRGGVILQPVPLST